MEGRRNFSTLPQARLAGVYLGEAYTVIRRNPLWPFYGVEASFALDWD